MVAILDVGVQASQVFYQRLRDTVLLGVGKLGSPRKGREGGASAPTEHRHLKQVGCTAKHAENQRRHQEHLGAIGHAHIRESCVKGCGYGAKFGVRSR